MTDKMARFAQKVKTYAANREAYNYSVTMQKAQHDKEFENMILDMSIGRVRGGSALAKRKYKFDYRRKDV